MSQNYVQIYKKKFLPVKYIILCVLYQYNIQYTHLSKMSESIYSTLYCGVYTTEEWDNKRARLISDIHFMYVQYSTQQGCGAGSRFTGSKKDHRKKTDQEPAKPVFGFNLMKPSLL